MPETTQDIRREFENANDPCYKTFMLRFRGRGIELELAIDRAIRCFEMGWPEGAMSALQEVKHYPKIGEQVVSEESISWLHDNHPEVYRGFYERVDSHRLDHGKMAALLDANENADRVIKNNEAFLKKKAD